MELINKDSYLLSTGKTIHPNKGIIGLTESNEGGGLEAEGLEILGVIGLNLPFLLKKFKKLVPIASAGLAMTMIGAIITHIGRGENFVPPLVLLAMALFVTYSRKDLLRARIEDQGIAL